jgi:hypothetical protein
MDLNIVECTELRQLMFEGAKYREHTKVDQAELIDEALQRFVTYCNASLGLPPSAFAAWCDNVKRAVSQQCPPPHTEVSVLERPHVKRALRQLHKHFVVCVTDKADKNFSIVCQNYYRYKLTQELQAEGGAYKTITSTPQQIYEAYARQLAETHVPDQVTSALRTDLRNNKLKLPIMYWLPKLHKPTPKERFIAASFDVMTTPLARVINSLLGLIKKELKTRDFQYYCEHGIRRCWFIDSFNEVTNWLRRLDRPVDKTQRCLQTYDFSTMYTTLDLEDIVRSVRYAVREAFGDRHMYIVFNGYTQAATWYDFDTSGPVPPPTSRFVGEQVTKMIHILVHNTFIQNGGHIRQQFIGLPMGTNPTPHLADLTCFAHEARTVDHLTIADPNKARKFASTFRYIDDILSVDNCNFKGQITLDGERPPDGAIYPSFLTLKDTTTDPTEVDFLGMNITNTPKSFKITVANTKNKFPTPKVNYPSLNGNFPAALGYGVLIGQLHRFARICTTVDDFVHWSANLCHTLYTTKGFSKGRCVKCFNSFIQTHSPYKTCLSQISRRFRYVLNEVSEQR